MVSCSAFLSGVQNSQVGWTGSCVSSLFSFSSFLFPEEYFEGGGDGEAKLGPAGWSAGRPARTGPVLVFELFGILCLRTVRVFVIEKYVRAYVHACVCRCSFLF